jgi:phage/plasmid-like protein (TIGR03299 family)
VWALAKINDSFSLFKDKDRVESYLLFTNPHQYGRCVDIRFTAIRVVCNNTLTLALQGKNDLVVRLNHRRKFDSEFVKKTLGIASDNMQSYKEMAEFLSKRKFTVDALKEYYETVFPSHSKKEKSERKMSRPARIALDVLDTQPGADFGRGTWWQAYNSATFAIDHLVGHSQVTRLNSAWYGPNRQRKVLALKKAVDFAEAA